MKNENTQVIKIVQISFKFVEKPCSKLLLITKIEKIIFSEHFFSSVGNQLKRKSVHRKDIIILF